jgi:hypothetical protein
MGSSWNNARNMKKHVQKWRFEWEAHGNIIGT